MATASVKEISDILRKRGNWLFQIQIPGISVPMQKKRVEEAIIDSPCLEAYFEKIAKNNNVSQYVVQLFQPNGTSFVKKTTHILMFDPIAVVAKSTKHVDEPTKHVDSATKHVDNATRHVAKRGRDLRGIDGLLEYRLDETEDKLSRAKTKISDLELKNRKLEEDNLVLTRENRLKDDKHELALLKVTLETASKAKEGLSGLMGDLNSIPPEVLKMLIGFFPNHPMSQQMLNGAGENTGALPQAKKHTDQTAESSIEEIRNLLHDKKVEAVCMIQMLVVTMLKNPLWLKKMYAEAYPENGQEPNLDDPAK